MIEFPPRDQMWEWFNAHYSVEALWSKWGAVVVGYAGFLVLERLIPAQRHPGRQEFSTDLRANLVFFLLNPLALSLGAWSSCPVAVLLGGPLVRLDLTRFGSQPVYAFLLAFLPFFVFDFFYYWFHRLQHVSPWLWQVHRLHHSEAFLNVTTSYRHHWLEEFFRAFFIFLPMNWMISIAPVHSAVAAVLIGQWTSFFHANIKLSFGALTGLITGPQYHRIHHSIEPSHIGKNYAAFFPVWDWVFGTYFQPERTEWPETGLLDTNGVADLREIVFSPFAGWWERLHARTTKPRL